MRQRSSHLRQMTVLQLLVKISLIVSLPVPILHLVFIFQCLIYFILLPDNSSPFIKHHFFVFDRQWSEPAWVRDEGALLLTVVLGRSHALLGQILQTFNLIK